MVSFKGAHFAKEIILTCVRWYLAYPLSYRQVEELMQGRGVAVDHATINRWVLKYSPQLDAAFHRRKQPVWRRWRMDETCIRVRGQWRYLYRAVDKSGQTIDFLLTEQRDERAAMRFLTNPSAVIACRRRLPSMGAWQVRPSSGGTTRHMGQRWRFGRCAISIMCWSRIIAL
jgi:transposase-like protein